MSNSLSPLEAAVKKLAKEISPDYPGIETVGVHECLYAIRSAYMGTNAANKDCHKIIEVMRKELGWSVGKLVDRWMGLDLVVGRSLESLATIPDMSMPPETDKLLSDELAHNAE